jgi:iron complex outermembrane receptor protein
MIQYHDHGRAMLHHRTLLASALALALATPAQADEAGQEVDPFHQVAPADIVVTAPFRLSRVDILASVSVLTGEELLRDLRSTIGDTLARQSGVSTTSFGPGSSRPVLRGQQGERVRLLKDGIGSIDVSNTSVDHAVAINPLLAERVEVLRGPAAILFGSSAIGGVVNVIDRRIPRALPADERLHLDLLGGYGSAADEWFGGGAISAPVAGRLMLHADGSWRDSGDLRVGGRVLARALREEALESTDPEIRALARLRGRLPNTASRQWEAGGGLSLVTDTGHLGVSVSRLENRYGVPIRFALGEHDHEHEHGGSASAAEPAGGHEHGPGEEVLLDQGQTRFDARAEFSLGGGWLERLRARFAYGDYRHAEIEADTGEEATVFLNQGLEGRIELTQRQRGPWRAAWGAQLYTRDFEAIGAEAFVPRNLTTQVGLFTLHSLDLGAVRAEAGARWEHSRIRSTDSLFPEGPVNLRRSFGAFSASAGASLRLGGEWRLGASVSRSARAPSAEELLANGPHAATAAFEVGDPDLRTEKSWGGELSLRAETPRYGFSAAAFWQDYDGFIELFPTGEEEDELPVFAFRQKDARFWGVEVEASAVLFRLADADLAVDVLADYTNARIKGVGPAPRIPPLRVRGGAEARAGLLTARLEAEHVFRQDRIAEFETETGAFTLINASLAVRPFGANSDTTLLLEGANLFDVNARRHASFLKDYAPLAGRDLRVTLRVGL